MIRKIMFIVRYLTFAVALLIILAKYDILKPPTPWMIPIGLGIGIYSALMSIPYDWKL